MSCLKPEPNSADNAQVPNNQEIDQPDTDGKDIYSELVQRSYDDLFEPFLNPDEEDKEDGQPEPMPSN